MFSDVVIDTSLYTESEFGYYVRFFIIYIEMSVTLVGSDIGIGRNYSRQLVIRIFYLAENTVLSDIAVEVTVYDITDVQTLLLPCNIVFSIRNFGTVRIDHVAPTHQIIDFSFVHSLVIAEVDTGLKIQVVCQLVIVCRKQTYPNVVVHIFGNGCQTTVGRLGIRLFQSTIVESTVISPVSSVRNTVTRSIQSGI